MSKGDWLITWIVQEKGLEQQLKTPTTNQKKNTAAAAAEPREEKQEEQQAAAESGENNNNNNNKRRSNLSPQKLRAAKFYAKKKHAQNPDT